MNSVHKSSSLKSVLILLVTISGLGVGGVAGLAASRGGGTENVVASPDRRLELSTVQLEDFVVTEGLVVRVEISTDDRVDRTTVEMLVDGTRVDRRTSSSRWDLEWSAAAPGEYELMLLVSGSPDNRTSATTIELAPPQQPTTGSISPPTEPSVASVAPTQPQQRSGTLFASIVVVRDRPSLSGTEITRIRNQSGSSITIEGQNSNGWYRISSPASGWIFGAFVLPPDPGLDVAFTTSGVPAVLLDSGGRSLGISNASGDKILITDRTESLWQVFLADGTTAFVDPVGFSLAS